MGVYALIAYGVAQRSREMALRVVLGARPRQVLRLVLGQGLLLTACGAAIGIAAARAAALLLDALLFGVGPADPTTFFIAPVLPVVVAAVATYFPARRALAVDPAEVLRQERGVDRPSPSRRPPVTTYVGILTAAAGSSRMARLAGT